MAESEYLDVIPAGTRPLLRRRGLVVACSAVACLITGVKTAVISRSSLTGSMRVVAALRLIANRAHPRAPCTLMLLLCPLAPARARQAQRRAERDVLPKP